MIRTFRYPLLPTKDQVVVLDGWLGRCCELYNAALQERCDAWKRLYNQQRELTELRAAEKEWKDVPNRVARSALARLDRAFQEKKAL
jgi:putative transposase